VDRPQGLKRDIGAYEDELVRIGGHVWTDRNRDDARDADDGISGVTVELAVKVAGSDPATYRAVRPKETDGDGAYSFEVTPGDWRVIVTDRVFAASHGPVSDTQGDLCRNTVGENGAVGQHGGAERRHHDQLALQAAIEDDRGSSAARRPRQGG